VRQCRLLRGERRHEILQWALFEPSLCILDEMIPASTHRPRCGLAADGCQCVGLSGSAMVVITHYQRCFELNYKQSLPDFVHVMSKDAW